MIPEEFGYNPQPAELCSAASGRRIGRLTTPFNTRSHVMKGGREIVHPSMWNKLRGDGWVGNGNGVLAKIEHRDTIASTRAGTLQLGIRSDGLDFTIDVANTHAGDDAIESVRSGLTPFSSWGMHVFEED